MFDPCVAYESRIIVWVRGVTCFVWILLTIELRCLVNVRYSVFYLKDPLNCDRRIVQSGVVECLFVSFLSLLFM